MLVVNTLLMRSLVKWQVINVCTGTRHCIAAHSWNGNARIVATIHINEHWPEHIHSVPEINGIGQLLLKISLDVEHDTFCNIVYTESVFSAMTLLAGRQEEDLACKNVWSEVQTVCIWSSWSHCFPKPHHLLPHLNPDRFYLAGTEKEAVKTGVVVVVYIYRPQWWLHTGLSFMVGLDTHQ